MARSREALADIRASKMLIASRRCVLQPRGASLQTAAVPRPQLDEGDEVVRRIAGPEGRAPRPELPLAHEPPSDELTPLELWRHAQCVALTGSYSAAFYGSAAVIAVLGAVAPMPPVVRRPV